MRRRFLLVLSLAVLSCSKVPAPPAQPTDLAASPSPFDATRVDLTWKDNSNDESSFLLERSLSADFTGATVVVVLGRDLQSYSVTDLAPATAYVFRLKSFNDHGESAYSNSATAITAPVARVDGDHFVLGPERLDVRGVNYYAKDAAWDRFWAQYPTAQIDRELGLARQLGMNTLRVFFPYGEPDADAIAGTKLTDLVGRLRDHGLLAIVTLFDSYASHEAAYDSSEYERCESIIDGVVSAVGAGNTTILAWDVKNEIDRDYASFGAEKVQRWARAMIGHMRSVDPYHLVTVGFYGGEAGTYDAETVNAFASDVDFLSVHYFLPERSFETALGGLTTGRPILLEEFGLHTLSRPEVGCSAGEPPGCDDPHTERDQAAYLNALLSLGESRGLAGSLLWTLTDFSAIQPGAQESHHCQGILRNGLALKDGAYVCDKASPPPEDYSEKPGAETIRRHFDPAVAYLDLFDSWVDLDQDSPPAGWTDNSAAGGGILRGYNGGRELWSHTPGCIALSQYLTDAPAEAASPLLHIDVDRYPFLAGVVSGYQIRSAQYGSDADLRVGVREGDRTSWLYTVGHSDATPRGFVLDLRQAAGWAGRHDFRLVLGLVPESGRNGYSATYELDWIGVRASPP